MLVLAAAICTAVAQPSSSTEPPEIPPASRPTLSRAAKSADGFAPPGWKVEQLARGDLNKDGTPDIVAVLKGADPTCIIGADRGAGPMDTNPRMLIVAFGGKDGYRLQVTNSTVIPRLEDPYMDDPLASGAITIDGGVIRLRLGSWRSAGGWSTSNNTLAFRWDGKRFALVGLDRDYLERNSGKTEQLSANYLTHRARITNGSIESDTGGKVRWRPVPVLALPSLETIGDGLEFADGQQEALT
jgi:hypothetical protein